MRCCAAVVVALVLILGVAASADDETTTRRFGPPGFLEEGRIFHTATLLPEDRVLVVGGIGETKCGATDCDHSPELPSAEVWDPETGEFAPAGEMTEARVGHTATPLPDGRVLIIGGYGGANGDEVLASAEIWDPRTSRFTPAGSLSKTRGAHTATLLPSGHVLVVGGEGGNCYRPRRGAEIWDPATAEFTSAGWLAQARAYHTAVPLGDGRVAVLGGTYDCLAEWVNTVEVWDLAVGTGFVTTGTWDGGRVFDTTTVLPDGRVVVAGGLRDGLPTEVNVWDPESGESSAAGALIEGRANHTATLLPDGQVLLIGGGLMTMGAAMAGEGYVLASAEVWDPETEESQPAGSLAAPRIFHTATALSDGRVLVVGGASDDGNATEAEMWDPATETFSAVHGPPGSVAPGRRVEVPEAGFALTLPGTWSGDAGWLGDEDADADAYLTASGGGDLACTVWRWDASSPNGGSWDSLRGLADYFVAERRTDAYGLTETDLRLPAGSAIRVDDVVADEDATRATYLLTNGADYFTLTCVGPGPATDRWLSIAETFEFLPDDE